MQKKRTFMQYFVDYLFITVGSAFMAVAVHFFLDPHNIVPGGVTGIAMMINYLMPQFPIGLTIIVINLPLFVLSWRFAGRRFLIYTIYGTVASSLLIDAIAYWGTATVEPLLAAIFGGVPRGAGRGLVFTRGATTGGSDVAARLLKLIFSHMHMGRLMLGVDLVVIAAAWAVFGRIDAALYAVVTLYVSTTAADAILYGLNTARVAYIISDRVDEVVRGIDAALGRGATLLHGEGAYTGDPKKVILCAIKRTQIAILKEIVKEIDPAAFIILSEAHEVLGEGFRDYDKHAL
ncbi:MAG: YitT family protein [Oscillospiraceae bacterium]|jgi:uncharacterized membrane-anchored protein YitT (DUF2179 family)|nr:YitT family protein [Oscillospiraceae bacterium]